MKQTIFLKDKRVTVTIGDPGKVPEVTMELYSPQIQIEDNKINIVETGTPVQVIRQ